MQIEESFLKFRKEAFRLELLPCYHVKSEWKQFQQFKKGVKLDTDEESLQFCKIISKLAKKGKRIIRVHVIPRKLTDYLRFEIETGYLPQLKAGAEIYLIYYDMYKNMLSDNFDPKDFWIFDNEMVIELIYTKRGKFLKEKLIEDKDLIKRYIQFKGFLVKNAIPLSEWKKK